MNRDLCREIVGCLDVTGSVEERLRCLRNFRPRDWESSLNWMNLSGIALAFYDRLQKFEAEDVVPPRVGAALAANLADHRIRIAAMRHEFDSLNYRFERAGIEYAAWKGFALVPEYCPDVCLRPIYDYDYLISEGDKDRAQDVLKAAGYARRPGHGTQHSVNFEPPQHSSGLPHSPDGYYAATLPRKVELHAKLWDEDAFGIRLRVPDRPLDRRSRRTWQGSRYYALAEEDAFLFQTLHTFQHILHNWCRLGWLWEIAYFMEHRHVDVPFWKKLCGYLEGNEPLTEIVALVISHANRLFHATLPAAMNDLVLGAMRGRIGLWMDRYGLKSALDNFSENKYSLFLYREFVRDAAAWRQIRNSRLLPLHRPNRVTGAASSAASDPLPPSWKQGWYIVQRLVHHSVYGVGYVWESMRWDRLRRQNADRAIP